jgi:hypothetical protein
MSDVREHRLAGHVPNRPEPVRHPHPLVDVDEPDAPIETDRLEPEGAEIDPAAGCHQQPVRRYFVAFGQVITIDAFHEPTRSIATPVAR